MLLGTRKMQGKLKNNMQDFLLMSNGVSYSALLSPSAIIIMLIISQDESRRASGEAEGGNF